jgi:hypothetical protein
MKRWMTTLVLVGATHVASLMVSCGEREPADQGTGGTGGNSGQFECFGSCYTGPVSPPDSCADLEARCLEEGAGGLGGERGTEECEGTLGLGGECGVCERSLSEYCNAHDCENPVAECSQSERQVISFGVGCHHKKVERPAGWTDPLPLSIDVWDTETDELVYHFARSEDDSTCAPAEVVGEMPDCESWSTFCDSGYACHFPPHTECHGCAPGCLYPEGPWGSCAEKEAALCGGGGEGGLGGFGGSVP